MSVKEQYRKYSLITIILGLGLLLFYKNDSFYGRNFRSMYYLHHGKRPDVLSYSKEKNFKKSVTAILLLIEAILCFLVPLSLAVWLFISKLQTVNVDTPGFVDTVTNLADWLRRKTEYDLLKQGKHFSIASILPAIGQFLMGGISSFAVNAVCIGLCSLFMLIGGTKMEKYIYELTSFQRQQQEKCTERN